MKDASIRPATPQDLDAMLAILPRLADFELPPRRRSDDLWESDADTLRRWAEDPASEISRTLIVRVAEAPRAGVVGVALVRLQPEFMSREPSAHLEALGIAPEADGHGLGRRLLEEVERCAQEAGARSMTLHVFANNVRARSVYDRAGYDGELMRYVKPLEGG